MLLIQTVENIPSINYLLFSLFLVYPFATHLSQVDNTLNQPQNCAPLANNISIIGTLCNVDSLPSTKPNSRAAMFS